MKEEQEEERRTKGEYNERKKEQEGDRKGQEDGSGSQGRGDSRHQGCILGQRGGASL